MARRLWRIARRIRHGGESAVGAALRALARVREDDACALAAVDLRLGGELAAQEALAAHSASMVIFQMALSPDARSVPSSRGSTVANPYRLVPRPPATNANEPSRSTLTIRS